MRTRLVMATLAAATAISATASADPKAPGIKMYDDVKHVESQIQSFPKREGTVNVGTLNMQTDAFTGYFTPEDEVDYGNEGNGPVQKPKVKKYQPVAIPTDAVEVTLQFHVSHYDGPWSVTANGVTTHVPAGQHTGKVKVGHAVSVDWSISTPKGVALVSRGRLTRPPHGAGAFVVPAIPVTILYQPPVDAQKLTFASYSVTKSVGTAVSVAFTDETKTRKADELPQFQGGNDFKKITDGAGKALGSTGNPYAAAIGAVLSIISAGMDSVTGTMETGTSTTEEHALRLGLSTASTFRTPQGAGATGPGGGDRIFYLKNARVAWVVTEAPGTHATKLSLALLGYDSQASASVDVLKADLAKLGPAPDPKTAHGQTTGLPPDAITNLLSLDPFAKSPGAQLDETRFAYYDEYESHSAGVDTYSLTSTQVTTNKSAKTDFSVRVTEYSRGFWTELGMGGDPEFENKTVTATTSHSMMGEQTAAFSTTAALEMHTGAGEDLGIRVFYDRVFGTFAFKRVPQGPERFGGVLTGSSGRPRAGQVVTLSAGGQTFRTKTDAQGRYSFRSTSIPAGIAASLHDGARALPVRTR